MSKTIDQKVVEMQFDNRQFEKNVSTTMSSIDKLKHSLNFTGATKGFEDIDKAAKKCDMSALGTAVDTIKTKFSALEVMGVTALANITNSAVNAGKRIISALTVDPITTGFQEYETQINAVQTILANTQSKGTTLSDVNAALDELNTYADKTIYNFTEMTRNIGTFTAAGVDLNKSVTAIQGIANLAAVSGSTSQQASTAMYQLSQALAAGKVSLMDWNSVVNAGMGGELFQNALKRTATQMGTNVDAMIKKYGSFRESLTEGGWLTAEVLTETLTQLSGAYTEADLIAQGYTESQAKEITQLAETAVDAATKVKTFTQLWDTLKEAAQSGWTQTWEILVGDFEEAKDLLTELSDTFGEIIGNSAEARNVLLYNTMTSNWKKITDGITEAGLSAEDFKDKVTEVAKSQGIDIDSIVADYGSLEAAFKNGALSSDLLDKALVKMTGTTEEIQKKLSDLRGEYKSNDDILKALNKAGYENADIQELITKNTNGQKIALNDLSDAQLMSIGYTAEQVKSIRELSDYAELASGSLKSFMDNVAVPQGRELLIDALRVSIRSLISIFETVGQAWRDVFPPTTSEELYNIIKGFRDFILAIRPSEETLDKLQRTFRGLFSILSIGKEIISAVVKAIAPLFKSVTGFGGGILDVTASIGDWIYNLDQLIKKSDIFNNILQQISRLLQSVWIAIKNIASVIKDKLADISLPGLELLHNLLEKIQERMAMLGDAAGGMGFGVSEAIDTMCDALVNSNFMKVLQMLWNGIKTIFGGITTGITNFVGSIADAIGSADFDSVLDILNTASIGGIAIGLSKFFKNLSEPLGSIEGVFDNVVGILDGVRGCLEAYQSNLKANTLLKIASAIAILAAAILIISTIDSGQLSASLGAITVLFGELMTSMALFSRVSGQITGVIKSTTAMLALSTAILILSFALKNLSDLDWDEMARGVIGVAGLATVMVASIKVLGSGSGAIVKGATQMVIFAAAIKILASACADLATLDWNGLAKGLVGVGVLLAEVSVFLGTAKFSGKTITTATGIVILAAAIKVLGSACADFAQMNWGEIGKGLASIAVLLAELAAFTRLTGNATNVISIGVALTAIATSMKIFASAIGDFGGLKWEEIAKGLSSMAVSLAAVTLAVRSMPKNMVGIGTGLTIVSASLLIVAEALEKFGSMSWEEITKGLATLGVSLAALAIGLRAMTGTLSGSAAMLVAASALAILTPVLAILGAMSWEGIAKGLASIAGSFVILGVAGAVLTPLVPSILGLAGAFTLIGVGVAAVGVGLLAAGAGLAAIATGIAGLATALAGGATVIAAGLAVIISSIASLIPTIAKRLGEGLIEILKVIAEAAPVLGESVKALVLTLIDVIVECVPAIADGVLELITGVLEAIVKYTPRIVDAIFQFLIDLLNGISSRLPELVAAAVEVVVAFFAGIIDALAGIDTGTLVKAIAGVGLVAAILLALSALSSLIPSAMAGVLGLAALVAEIGLVLAAFGGLAQIPGVEWIIDEGANLLQSIGNAIGGFVGGIVGGVLEGIAGSLPDIATDLSGFMENITPFIEGAKKIDASALRGVEALADVILTLTAANILDSLTSWFTGGSALTKFAEELVPFGTAMKQFSQEIAGIDGNLVMNAALAGKALAEMADTIPNSGGVVGFFAGENDLGAFATQLISFGTAMKSFSISIAGMDTNAVTNAAIAGEALASMADTVPNSGGVVGFFTGENDLGTFAEQIVPFGSAMKSFAESIEGIDSDSVVNAATAGQALAAMADTVPNSGGVVGFFTGDNNLEEFGEQLIPFGEAMKNFSFAVQGIDPDSVVNAATAGQALVELANTVPNCGGLVSFFAGDNHLDTFGEQLVPFGRSIKQYSLAVAGMDAEAIINSATAGAALVELANTLPNCGGLVSLFSGDNTMDVFGSQLVSFGADFRIYSDYMKGVDAGIVTNTANAASSLVELQKSLPENKLFKNETWLDEFGAQLSEFGGYFASYYQSVSGIDTTKLSSVVSQVNRLVSMAKGMTELDTSGMTGFGKALTTLGNNGIDGFIDAFDNASSKITQSASKMLTTFTDAVEAKENNVIKSFSNIVDAVIDSLNKRGKVFTKAGKEFITKLSEGIKSSQSLIKVGFDSALTSAITSIRGRYTDFYNAGGYLVQGFSGGMAGNMSSVILQAQAMANAAYNSAMKTLDAHSPSRLFETVGSYVPLGFARGISSNTKEIENSADAMAKTAINSTKDTISRLADAINSDIDTQPTIRPVIDLSDVESKAGSLNAMFTRNRAMSIGSGMKQNGVYEDQNGASMPTQGVTNQFIQNNYSPKALSRVEIYRQTKNQFSAFERVVKA